MNSRSLMLAALLLQTIAASAQEKAPKLLEVDSRASMRFTQVTGPGRGSSFYKDGTYLVEEPNIVLRRNFADDWRATIDSRLRLTNDRLTDIRGFSVESMSLEVKNSSHNITFGDYFAVMSQYSMSQLIKGLGYQRNFRDEENYVRAAVGSFDPQWEYLYKTEVENEPMNRFGGGMRGQVARENFRAGMNWAFVQDDKQDPLRVKTQEDAYYQQVGAFDWEYRLGVFTLDGEHAAAVSVKSPLAGERQQTSGHANRFRLQGAALGTRVQATFENVSPDFLTLAGSASKDRRRYGLQASRRFGRLWQAFAKLSLTHDDLEGAQLKTRTTNTSYDLGGTRYKLFGRKDQETTLTWRRVQTDTRNFSRDKTSDRFQLSVSDQLWKTLRVRANFEPSLDEDHVRNTDALNFLYELRLSAKNRLPRDWSMSTTLAGRRRDTENLLAMGYDRQMGANARVEFSRPGGLSTGAEFDYTMLDIMSGLDSRTKRVRTFLQLRPRWLADSSVDLDAGMTHYGFTQFDKDYAEYLVKLAFNWRI